MKLLILMVIVTMHYNCFYAMELSTSYIFEKTKITLKQALFDVNSLDGKVEFICIGCYGNQLGKKIAYNEHCAGDIHTFHRKSVMIEVIEPLLFKSEYDGEYHYYVEKHCAKDKQFLSGSNWYGDEALEKVKSHLDLCYKNVLAAGLHEEFKKTKKRIALPTLGATVNFPKEEAALVAVPSILEFLRKNQKAEYYYRIDLFVQEESQFDLYRMLLDFYIKDVLFKNFPFCSVNFKEEEFFHDYMMCKKMVAGEKR